VSRLLVLSGLAAWLGCTLLLSCLRAVRRISLTERLRPYAPAAGRERTPRSLLSADSFREVVRPVAELGGGRIARVVGVTEDLARRLHRVHADLDPTAFRLRQVGASVGAFGAGSVAALLLPVPPSLGLLVVLGAPALAFLVIEQRLAQQSARWQHRVFVEIPVVSEQLGMLLSSGWSLGTSLQHLADRGGGACSRDLARVCQRIQQGLAEHAALQEWSDEVQVPAVRRLVAVLALSHDATDLGALVAEEARSARRDAHRRLLEAIERRTQQVWIPVTVATLVPGVLLLAVPFLQALRLFSAA